MFYLERVKKFCSRLGRYGESGLFNFWCRFGSVAGRCGHAPSPKRCQKSKNLAPNGYRISLTAPAAGISARFLRHSNVSCVFIQSALAAWAESERIDRPDSVDFRAEALSAATFRPLCR
jgi:hypothetical protein